MGNGSPEAVRADAESWETAHRWEEQQARLSKLALEAGGQLIRHQDLKPGDRFKLFLDHGTLIEMGRVYIHDRLDGYAHCHEEATGRKTVMTGEMQVVKLTREMCPFCQTMHNSDEHDLDWYFVCCGHARLVWKKNETGGLDLLPVAEDMDAHK